MRQKEHDQNDRDSVDDPLHLRAAHNLAQNFRHQSEDQPADDRPGQRALAPPVTTMMIMVTV